MDKTVYSMILDDDVVRAVDQLAYEKGTSRSNLINQILAEYFSFSTPEMRMKSIFETVEQTMADLGCFQVQFQPSDAMITIRSALRYRYNPSIRYVLELYRRSDPVVGEMRVSLRTQNQTLIRILTAFFSFWLDLETRTVSSCFPQGRVPAKVEPGRYARRFILPGAKEKQTDDGIAEAISDYIQFFDSCLKYYFAELDNPEAAQEKLERQYRQYVTKEGVI
ncbi:MAG: hypothetical protein GX424_10770 [Clostridiales bacterium]|nr:hypothetical protein [Clostridiales bacterium]